RDFHVTGVQTCALPIFVSSIFNTSKIASCVRLLQTNVSGNVNSPTNFNIFSIQYSNPFSDSASGGTKMIMDLLERNGLSNLHIRSEERRVGKLIGIFLY